MDLDKVKELLDQANELYAEILDYDFRNEDLRADTIDRISEVIEELEGMLRDNS